MTDRRIQNFYAGSALLLWATFAALGVRLAHVPPFLLVGSALLIGGLCSIHRIREWKIPLRVLLVGVYGLFGFHFFIFMALRLAPPVEANLINYLWPLLLVLLSPLFLSGYRLNLWHVLSAGLGFAGAALIVTGGHASFEPGGARGYACAAAAAFIWATYSLMTKRVRAFPTAAIGLFCMVAGGAALACHFAFEPRYAIAPGDLPYLILLGVGPMGAAFFCWDAALKRGDPRWIGSLAFSEPLLSTLVLVAFGLGKLSATAGVALLLILAGAMLGARASRAAPLSSPLKAEPGR